MKLNDTHKIGIILGCFLLLASAGAWVSTWADAHLIGEALGFYVFAPLFMIWWFVTLVFAVRDGLAPLPQPDFSEWLAELERLEAEDRRRDAQFEAAGRHLVPGDALDEIETEEQLIYELKI